MVTRTMVATVVVYRWNPGDRSYDPTPVATLPVMRAHRAARKIAARLPSVESTWDLRGYAHPAHASVFLGSWGESGRWSDGDERALVYLASYDAPVRYVESIGDQIRSRGWAAV